MTKMTSLLTSLYLLSFREVEIPHNDEVDCIKVSKKDNCIHYSYGKEKKELSQSQTKKCKKNWNSKRSTIEKLFRSYKSIFLSWDSNQPIKIFFSNGSIVSIQLSNDNNSLEKIEIDNDLVGKFISSRIVDAIIVNNSIYVTYCEPKLTLINFNQDHSSLSSKILGLKKGILTGSELRINHFDLIGPCNKSIERKLSLNVSNDNLLVWWKSNSDDVFPWVPVAYSTDRINMTVYDINDSFQVLCTVKTQGVLIQADYSKLYSHQILTLEKVKGESCDDVNICVYEIIDNHCYHTFVSKLPLRGSLLSCDWSSNEKLLISDSDHLLLIYDLKKRTSIVTNLLYLPKQIAWHPQNSIAFVIGVDSQLQCFDTALTCVKFQMLSSSHLQHHLININSYFSSLFTVQKILWQKSKNSCICLLDSEISSILILNVCTGCFTQNNLGVMELCNQYLKSNLIDEAILLLRSLSWSHEGELSFQCLSKIANCLFRKPFNSHNQIGLEVALGTYYESVDNLSKHVIKIYQNRIRHIARRFFHYLLRNLELRKAFLLAVDLESQDLFLDLYNIAKRKNEKVLALVALQKAEEFNLSSDSYSTTSSSCDYESETSSDYSEENYGKPEYTPDRLLNSNYLFNQNQYGLPISRQCLLTENRLNTSDNAVQTLEPFQNDDLASTSATSSGITKLKAISDKDPYSSVVYSPADPGRGRNLTFSNESQQFSQSCDTKHTHTGASSVNFSFVENSAKTHSDFNSGSLLYEGDPPNVFRNVKVHSTSAMRPLPSMKNSKKSGSSGEVSDVHHKKDVNNLKQGESVLVSCKEEIYDDDTEELENSRIKLVHFGII